MNWLKILQVIGPAIVEVIIPRLAEFLKQLILDAIAQSEIEGGSGKEKLERATDIVKRHAPEYSEKQIQDAISATVDATNKVYAHTGTPEK